MWNWPEYETTMSTNFFLNNMHTTYATTWDSTFYFNFGSIELILSGPCRKNNPRIKLLYQPIKNLHAVFLETLILKIWTENFDLKNISRSANAIFSNLTWILRVSVKEKRRVHAICLHSFASLIRSGSR